MKPADCLLEPVLWASGGGEMPVPGALTPTCGVPKLFDGLIGTHVFGDVTAIRPSHIGPYVVLRLLKIGGQAEVYLARHPEYLRDVVVKWMHGTIAHSHVVAQNVAEEARFLSVLRHPAVVCALDLGIAAGRPYLVLEHIAGRPLGEPDAPPLAPREAARVIAAVARGLHAVHHAGRLHLDIQPDNILLDQDGRPRLIDFGLSRPIDGCSCASQSNPAQGTLEYMPPEQLAGKSARLSPTSDVYSLGAVLYELLTGERPQPEVTWKSPVLCSRHFDSRRLQGVPRALQRICRRALEPDPGARFASAAGLATALERFADGHQWPRLWTMVALLAVSITLAATFRPHISEAPIHPSVRFDGRADALNSALHQLLDSAAEGDRSAWLVLADGRQLPINLTARPQAANVPPPSFIEPLADELSATRGTSMLLVVPPIVGCGADNPHTSCRWAELRLPNLPEGTLAMLTEQHLALLNTSAEFVPTPPVEQALRLQLQRLQQEIASVTPRFRAVVVAGRESPQNR